jgi:anti-sigma regulatory factor (Ser/Thr protein kinase)
LLASEIATNAIRHGGVEDVLQVAIEYRDGLLRVSVRQPNAFERHADQTEGWGLTLLDRLADTWTTELLDDGWTKVTFELTEIGGRKV